MDEEKNVSKCLMAVENFLKEDDRQWGKLRGQEDGYFSKISFAHGSLYISYIVDRKLNKLFCDILVLCYCPPAYTRMMRSYLNFVSSMIKTGCVDFLPNGEVKVRFETSISDSVLTSEEIEDLEHMAIAMTCKIRENVTCIASGSFPDGFEKMFKEDEDYDDDDDDDESDADDGIEKLHNLLKGLLPPDEEDESGNDGEEKNDKNKNGGSKKGQA